MTGLPPAGRHGAWARVPNGAERGVGPQVAVGGVTVHRQA